MIAVKLFTYSHGSLDVTVAGAIVLFLTCMAFVAFYSRETPTEDKKEDQ